MSGSVLKWHGGKHYLAADIIGLMPKRYHKTDNPDGWLHYVEPYAGGLSVLLANDPEGISEVANDLNKELTNFWRVLQTPEAFSLFQRRIAATTFSEWEWTMANRRLLLEEVDVSHAASFFVRCRQSMAGRMKGFAPLSRTRVRRGMNEQAAAWLSAVEGLPEVHERLKRVVVLNHKAVDVIRQQDGPKTLHYMDPPYAHETRVSTGEYAHEMTASDHAELLMTLETVKGKFLLSGYRCKMYDEAAADFGWHRTDFDLPNNAAGGEEKRRMTECVWTNYDPKEGK